MNYGNTIKEINPIVYETIKNSYENNKMSHSYILSAEQNVTINNEALYLIQTLISDEPFKNTKLRTVSTYPDLTIIDGTENKILKDDVISAMESLQKTALDVKGVKVLWIKNIENANTHSLNSLLKFIEEPTENTYIIITTNNISQVISTIKSRSQIINILKITHDKFRESLKKDSIEEYFINILVNISSSRTEAIKLAKSKMFQAHWDKIIEVSTIAIKDQNILFQDLSKYINKKNVKLFLKMYLEFFSDIYRQESKIDTAFHLDALNNTYKKLGFKYWKAFEIINEFYNNIDNNINFELSKTNFLMRMEELYG